MQTAEAAGRLAATSRSNSGGLELLVGHGRGLRSLDEMNAWLTERPRLVPYADRIVVEHPRPFGRGGATRDPLRCTSISDCAVYDNFRVIF